MANPIATSVLQETIVNSIARAPAEGRRKRIRFETENVARPIHALNEPDAEG